MASYRVGIIGPGLKGVEYAVAYRFHPQTELVAAADTDAETLALVCDRFAVPGYADYRDMLARERLDIVAAILPVGAQHDVVVGCAQAGIRAVQCEKPMAATLADADRMVEACRANGVSLAVGDLDRNLPEYGIARALIEAGEIGEVSSITATGGTGTELSGGGCQVLSLVRLFAGDADVAWAIGWMTDDAASDHDQGGAGYLRFVTGAEAVLHRSPDARGMGIEAAGSRGVIRVSADVVRLWRRPDEDPGVPAAERDSWQRLQPVDEVFPEGSIRNADKGSRDGWVVPANRQAATVQAPDARGMGIEAAGSRGVIRVSADVVRLWRRPDEDPGVPAAERDSWQRLQPVDEVFPEGSIRNADKGSRDGWVVPANRQAATVQALVTALDSGEAPPSDGINGRAVLEMAIAIRESHRQGHAPVRLPLADRNLRLIPKRRRLQDKKPFLWPGVVPARAAQAARHGGCLILIVFDAGTWSVSPSWRFGEHMILRRDDRFALLSKITQ